MRRRFNSFLVEFNEIAMETLKKGYTIDFTKIERELRRNLLTIHSELSENAPICAP